MSPNSPEPRTVSVRRGRPRKYEHAAERHRAYRLRRKQRLAELEARAAQAAGGLPGAAPGDAAPKPCTGKELLDALIASGFIGRWKDRTDIGDSVEFARKLGHEAEMREWE